MPNKKKIFLEQKIELFERFKETGNELDSKTVFEGHPIGLWAIQIRSLLKKQSEGKVDRSYINPTDEQLSKLESLGILKGKIDSTLDKKIETMIEWRKQYPKIRIIPMESKELLKEHAETDDEYAKIKEEYEKIQNYYGYVRSRKSKNKLNEEQLLKCKEGNVGGVFGYSTKIEELAKKYNVSSKDMDYIISKYGSIDKFYEMHKDNNIEDKKDIELESTIIKNAVDIDKGNNNGYDKLCRATFENSELIIYSSEKLKEMLNTLTDREKNVLEKRYGLIEGAEPKTVEKTAKDFDVSKERIRQIEVKALRKLRNTSRSNKFVIFDFSNDDIQIVEDKHVIGKLEKDIQLKNGNFLKQLERTEELMQKCKENEKMIIDYKIDSLIDWSRISKVKVCETSIDTREYRLMGPIAKEEYKKMQRYYIYVSNRREKLDEEQIHKCKEGNVRGVFGYPTKVEKLAQKYNVTEEDIDYILTQYDSIDNFYEMYKDNKIMDEREKILTSKIIKDVIDIDGNNENYDNLLRNISGSDNRLMIYSSKKLKEEVETLTDNQKTVLQKKYGLIEGTEPQTYEDIAEEFNRTKTRIKQIENLSIHKLRNSKKMGRYVIYDSANKKEILYDDPVVKIEKDIQIQNGNVEEKIETLKLVNQKIKDKNKEERVRKLQIEIEELIAQRERISNEIDELVSKRNEIANGKEDN